MEYSPRSASPTNRTRSFIGSVALQGMLTSRRTPYPVLPMFPVYSVTYVPGLHPRIRSPRPLTAALESNRILNGGGNEDDSADGCGSWTLDGRFRECRFRS